MTFAELTAGLLWPRLLRAFPLALQPPRLLLGLAMILWTLVVGSVFDAATPIRVQPAGFADATGPFAFLVAQFREGMHACALGAVRLDAARVFDGLRAAVVTGPRSLIDQAPGAAASLAVTILIFVVPVVCLLAAAACRMVACDVASDLNLGLAPALATARRKWRSLLGAVLGPLALMGVLALLIATLGLVMLRFNIVNIAGGVLYGVPLLLGAALVFVAVGYALGGWMLLPAVMVEGTDAIDAIQRAYAYTIGRPGRLAMYGAALLALLAVSSTAIALLIAEATQWTASLANAWTGAAPLSAGAHAFAAAPASEHGGTASFVQAAVRWWESFAMNLVAAYAASFLCSGSTLLYLLLRRVNDEQDIEDIWSPEACAAVSIPAVAPVVAAEADGTGRDR